MQCQTFVSQMWGFPVFLCLMWTRNLKIPPKSFFLNNIWKNVKKEPFTVIRKWTVYGQSPKTLTKCSQSSPAFTYQLCLPHRFVSFIPPPAELDTFHTSHSKAPDRSCLSWENLNTKREAWFTLFPHFFFLHLPFLFLLPTESGGSKKREKERKKTDVLTQGFPHFSLSQPQSPQLQSCQGSFHLLS